MSQFFSPLYPPPHPPAFPPFSWCPRVIHISSLASPFPTLFVPSPGLFYAYQLCFLFPVPFPPFSPSPSLLITLHVISISVIPFLFLLTPCLSSVGTVEEKAHLNYVGRSLRYPPERGNRFSALWLRVGGGLREGTVLLPGFWRFAWTRPVSRPSLPPPHPCSETGTLQAGAEYEWVGLRNSKTMQAL